MVTDYALLIAQLADLVDGKENVKVLVAGIHFVPTEATVYKRDTNMVKMTLANGSNVIIHGSQISAIIVESQQPSVVA
jgi:hypothetical protein